MATSNDAAAHPYTSKNTTTSANGGSAFTPTTGSAAAAATATTTNASNAVAPAARMITEDERRMKFLALLCGTGAFPRDNNSSLLQGGSSNINADGRMIRNGPGSNTDSRQRSSSVSSIGKVMVEGSGVMSETNDGNITTAMEIDLPQTTTATSSSATAVDTKLPNNGKSNDTATKSSDKSASATRPRTSINNDNTTNNNEDNNEPNYNPTTPHNLSRRILHKSSVGYLDESVPLLTSALSDRFLATVLVQAMACRDRRIEGYKATLRQRKRRRNHQKRVAREQLSRDGTTMLKLKLKGGGSGEDYQKMAKDLDNEEEYYESFYDSKSGETKKKRVDGNEDVLGEEYISENEESDGDEDDDEEELIDESQYDIKLRDLVRPLSAWGFDLTGKMGFHNNTDEADIDRKLQEDEYDSASDGDDMDVDEENEDGENDESDGDLLTDEEVTGKKSASSSSSSPKKKKKTSTTTQSKTKKSAATTKKKAATAKRKREDEKEGEGGGGDGTKVKKEEEHPKKKAATTVDEVAKKPTAADNK